MNNISEIPALMIEMFDTCPNYNLTPRGIEIINEIADYAEQTEMFKMNESRGEIFEGKPSKFIFEYMLDRVVCAIDVTRKREHNSYYAVCKKKVE